MVTITTPIYLSTHTAHAELPCGRFFWWPWHWGKPHGPRDCPPLIIHIHFNSIHRWSLFVIYMYMTCTIMCMQPKHYCSIDSSSSLSSPSFLPFSTSATPPPPPPPPQQSQAAVGATVASPSATGGTPWTLTLTHRLFSPSSTRERAPS